jgi:hypothetical protein
VNGHLVWILVVLASGILFLGYAKVGSRGERELHLFDGQPVFGPRPAAAGPGDRPPPAEAPAGPPAAAGDAHPTPVGASRGRHGRPWWEH